MRNMSFALTTQQIIDETKTVTRRLGWDFLKPGDQVMAVKKGMGLKKGEKIERLKVIEVVSNTPEALVDMIRKPSYGCAECFREGFPNLNPEAFITMFQIHNKCDAFVKLNRIEFKYVTNEIQG